mgnify:CR=1 FL=1
MKISLFIPCLVDQFAPQTGMAVVNVLERLGHEVHYDDHQTCCGQALFNSGFRDEATSLAERFVRLFGDGEVIVAPSGSCVNMVQGHYGEVGLTGEALRTWEAMRERTYEFSTFLVEKLGVTDVGATFPHTVSLHNSCHFLHGVCRSNLPDNYRELLTNVDGLTLVEEPVKSECCGFGGAFSAKYPELSKSIARRRIDQLALGEAEFITGVDDSCLMHMQGAIDRRGGSQRTIHLARILDAS